MKYLFTFFLDLENSPYCCFYSAIIVWTRDKIIFENCCWNVFYIILVSEVANMLHSVMWNNNKYIHRVIYLIFV